MKFAVRPAMRSILQIRSTTPMSMWDGAWLKIMTPKKMDNLIRYRNKLLVGT